MASSVQFLLDNFPNIYLIELTKSDKKVFINFLSGQKVGARIKIQLIMKLESKQLTIKFPEHQISIMGIPARMAEIRVSYSAPIKKEDRITINKSNDCYEVFWRSWNKSTVEYFEEFKVLYLNRANQVLGLHRISQGGITGTVADVRIILGTALKVCASCVILAHNHPSGNLNPSQADRKLTTKIKEGAKLVDVEVLDHLIITSEGYYSFADEGEM